MGLELGKKQTLQVIKEVKFGVYLAMSEQAEREDQVLLPAKQVPAGTKKGDSLSVFLYKDSDDRLIATTAQPLITLHETALLTVRQLTKIGAFLDWGLEKDLLLPFREQRGNVRQGDQVLVALYVDKSGRLSATMNVYPWLKTRAPYQIGDSVQGRVYEISRNFGVFIAVDDRYSALIPKREAQGSYEPGQVLKLRVTEVREDGRLCVSARQKAWQQIGGDAEQILEKLRESGGTLPFDDKAPPERISDVFGISKAAFKRAVGHLLKENLIRKRDGRIELK
ncbi:MAG: S1 RNA-binding domain-containing protein [Eubacterium sp.]|nr:S1 RNA-binding domain-containing protein [Eubacterium sp.]